MNELSILDAIVLGLVEGLTEYLPISSTGHLLITNKLLGLGGTQEADDALDTYAICIQSGAILAVLLLYKQRVWQMVDGLLGRSDEGRRVLLAVVAAFVPTAIIGQFVFPIVRDRLFGQVTPIAGAWLIGGIAILFMQRSGFLDRAGHELNELTAKQAAVIGLLQAIAIWPGVSRSLVTIVAGVVVGMKLTAAVEFSFLLGLITLSAATVYAALGGGAELVETFGVVSPLVGLVVAFISAVIAIRWMVDWLQQRGFEAFGWYRIGIGVIALAAVGSGTW
ncbi:MAG: undecaprenyl-diphosphatase [Acidimicrobiales bacterium]